MRKKNYASSYINLLTPLSFSELFAKYVRILSLRPGFVQIYFRGIF